jgi:FkbM family methyltransferase
MKMNNIKNKFFKLTIKLIGNKGLAKNRLGNSVKDFLTRNCKTNEMSVNGYKMLLHDNMEISLRPYEPIETEIVKTHVEKNNIVVDIGANIGYYTLLMALNQAKVFSYEPEPKNFKLLQKNVNLNNFSSNVKLYNKAVSNYNGFSKLFLAGATDLNGGVIVDRAKGGAPGMHTLSNNRFGSNSIDVEVTKLNLDKIDFAKIDVEGHELHVLEGMKILPTKILIEFNPLYLQASGKNYNDFFHFIEKFTIKQISKDGLEELDYEELIKSKMSRNLFLY